VSDNIILAGAFSGPLILSHSAYTIYSTIQ